MIEPVPNEVEAEVIARVRRRGPIPFDEVVELALYHPTGGFYASGGAAGRRGDFLTSPEVGPLFGAVMAHALDAWWRELGEPDPFTVVDAGAGRGALARTILEAAPACLPALTYVLVERSAALRSRHAEFLTLGDSGPCFVSLPELPAVPIVGVVLANELLDNLAFRLLERRRDAWFEVRVGLAADDATLVEQLVPIEGTWADQVTEAVEAPIEGARIPLQAEAGSWLRAAFEIVERGRVVVIDYADTTESLAARPSVDWLRTYRGHERGVEPLTALGTQDITCEVAIDQVARVRLPDRTSTQAEFLTRWGIDGLVAEGRRVWHERAAIGDLEAMKARSRVREADALTDPAGLGAFRVLEWSVG